MCNAEDEKDRTTAYTITRARVNWRKNQTGDSEDRIRLGILLYTLCIYTYHHHHRHPPPCNVNTRRALFGRYTLSCSVLSPSMFIPFPLPLPNFSLCVYSISTFCCLLNQRLSQTTRTHVLSFPIQYCVWRSDCRNRRSLLVFVLCKIYITTSILNPSHSLSAPEGEKEGERRRVTYIAESEEEEGTRDKRKRERERGGGREKGWSRREQVGERGGIKGDERGRKRRWERRDVHVHNYTCTCIP